MSSAIVQPSLTNGTSRSNCARSIANWIARALGHARPPSGLDSANATNTTKKFTEGAYDGSIGDLQDPIPQDRDEPPLSSRQRCSEWDGVVKDEPTRFVCAGASRVAVAAAIASF